jgi:RNA polymerase sigma-70 factor (ECF subfamily)
MSEAPPGPDGSAANSAGTASLQEWFGQYRERLRNVVALRLDRRLMGRLDPSDVIQETYLEALQRYPAYARDPRLSPYLWLRFLAVQRLLICHRRHLQTQKRDAGLEISLDAHGLEVSSAELAQRILDSALTPAGATVRAEEQGRLHQALQQLEPLDREVLALRHFEYLSNDEAAAVLGIQPGAASQRYYRALKRLKGILTTILGGAWSASGP